MRLRASAAPRESIERQNFDTRRPGHMVRRSNPGTRSESRSESGATSLGHHIQIGPVTHSAPRLPLLRTDVYERALNARDARFDGVFFVGITTTGIYCRPVCPSRFAASAHRRFFNSPAAAERAGYRPCLRCRPELAPGCAAVNVMQHLAGAAAHRISAGALNGRSVATLAQEFGVGERHLRRALERELGVSPVELAQTHRLLLAKRLLADTQLSITQIAFASGFQSVRRFNTAFLDHYRMSPSAVRRVSTSDGARPRRAQNADTEMVQLTLGYRAPLAWDAVLEILRRHAMPTVEVISERRYCRTLRLGDHRGLLVVSDGSGTSRSARVSVSQPHVQVELSASLVPALMPLLARLRQLFDLDAEPGVIDAHLEQGGLGPLVGRCPGMRVPGVIDGFEFALVTLLEARRAPSEAANQRARDVIWSLGEPLESPIPGLSRLAPSVERIAEAGVSRLVALGVPQRRAQAIVELAQLVVTKRLSLEPGSDVVRTHQILATVEGIGERLATIILMRAQRWPDAFPASDPVLQRAAGVSSPAALLDMAEQWRPWRAYASMHLWLGAAAFSRCE